MNGWRKIIIERRGNIEERSEKTKDLFFDEIKFLLEQPFS